MLAAIALISILAPLNSTMIAVALPSLVDDFGESLASAGWLVTAYLVVMASIQPLAGKLGDSMGRRQLILTSLILFTGVSVGAALAPNIWILLAFRVGQAVSISIALSNGFAVVRQVVSVEQRGRSFGIIEAVTGLSAATGPLVGGLLVTALDWRAIFFVNLPFIVIATVLAWRTLPRDTKKGAFKGFDYYGAAFLPAMLFAAAIFFLLLARGNSPAVYVPTGVVSLVLLAALIRIELRHPDPVFQPRFFKKRGFAAPSVSVGTSNLAMYSMLLVIPLLMAARGGFSELDIGLVLTSLSVGMALLTPLGGWMADHFGRRIPAVTGLALGAIAMIAPAVVGADIGVAPLVLSLGALGLGLGLSNTGMRVSALESVSMRNAGSGAGAYSTSRYFGSIVGSAILAGLIGVDRSNMDGIDDVFVIAAVSAFFAVVAALFMVARPSVD